MTEKFKFEAYEVDTLEKSVNDSAVRVSTIWVSYLIFALYLIIAVSTVTHRQILLEEPIRLPVLNIDLPLWGFFFLAPILFVIFHGYVLLQVVLLGRTAAAYSEAVDRSVKSPSKNAFVRQRLANTLFAQIFAGSPRERQGVIGGLLKLMAWVTLAIAPALVLLVFQFKFLPYQSHFVTWAQRLLLLTELITVFLLWPLALDARREIEWRRLMRHPLILASAVLFVFVSLFLATFPGEPHVNIFTGHPVMSVECERWFTGFDRLDLPRVDVVDDQKLARIEREAEARELAANQREPTQQFTGRNLRCGTFKGADFRGVDFTLADLQGASLSDADLKDSIFDRAQLRNADMSYAKLLGANLTDVGLQNANLNNVQLPDAFLSGVNLEGARLMEANLQGSRFMFARLAGASFYYAKLQGALLSVSDVRGASFDQARLQGSALYRLDLAGATLRSARLQGALIYGTRMEVVDLDKAQLQGAALKRVNVWGATGIPIFDLTDLQEIDSNSKPWEETSTFAEWRHEVESKSREPASLAKRLAAIDPLAETQPEGVLASDFWERARSAQLQGEKLLIGRAALVADLACSQSAPWVARNLFRDVGLPFGGVANIQGSQALIVADRLRKGRSEPAGCPGAKDLSDGELADMFNDTERVRYEEAAKEGDANAMTNLGVLYGNGQGVAQDYIKAREWYERAAAKGNATAMTNLGVLYGNGQGVAQDYIKAREWYERAAAEGEANAMSNLGALYENGQGVTQDYIKAREWYERAAAKGNATAMTNLEKLSISEAAGAGRYAEALQLQEAWAAKVEEAETKREGKPGEETANALANVAWHALFAREFTKASAVADRAHALLPDDLTIETNRAHALMFLGGHGDDSKALYLAHKGKPVSEQDGRLWERVILEDFLEFRKAGLTDPMMADIEKELSVSR